MANIHSCNILDASGDRQHIWRFFAEGDQFALAAEQSVDASKALPDKWVARNWSSLWQRKINVAWFPLEHVFLRVIQLPQCDFTELLAMVEFQLEKLSPLPVAQIVWTAEVAPQKNQTPEAQQTVVVIIVARNLVEQFLGRLETNGYQPDRIELPEIHQLLSISAGKENSAVLYHRKCNGKHFCLAAWWHEGALQHLGLLHLTTPENWGAELSEHLTQMSWAGELEGWLTTPPKWRLIADRETAPQLQPLLQQWANQPVEVLSPLSLVTLAEFGAQRAAQPGAENGLLPAEFSTRYRQQFIDGLWMRSVGVLLIVYMAAVAIYFVALEVLKFQKNDLSKQVTTLSPDYNKTRELGARIQVLQSQIGLRYAVLDAWKAVIQELPKELNLTDLQFQRGKKLTIMGRCLADDVTKITDFSVALGKVKKMSDPTQSIFSQVDTPRSSVIGNQLSWSFSCELNLPETQ